MKKFVLFTIILVLIALVAGSFLPNFLSQAANNEEVSIIVAQGESLSKVADDLHEKGVIRSKLWFK